MDLLKPTFFLLLLWQMGGHSPPSQDAATSRFRYVRQLTLPAASQGQACAVLDGDVFAHAAPSLKDLRLFSDSSEAPYAVTLSDTGQQESEEAKVLNAGLRAGRIVFDLEMPHRNYTSVSLDLRATDFIATAMVSGRQTPHGGESTSLGSFTLFDLSSQHLSRNTTIPLQESNFPFLHVELSTGPASGSHAGQESFRDSSLIRAASVPPSREAQTLYTTIAQTSILTPRGKESVAVFELPKHVPVERILFELVPGHKGNFSREVRVKAQANGMAKEHSGDVEEPGAAEALDESFVSTINRLRTVQAGHEIAEESLSVQAVLGSNMQRAAAVEVAIENGDDPPLPIEAVRLQMRQRKICFDAATEGRKWQLYYGDDALDAPVYDYAKLFRPSERPIAATLEDERLNPEFRPSLEPRPFTDRHPELLWIGVLLVVCVLALTAFRSAKSLH